MIVLSASAPDHRTHLSLVFHISLHPHHFVVLTGLDRSDVLLRCHEIILHFLDSYWITAPYRWNSSFPDLAYPEPSLHIVLNFFQTWPWQSLCLPFPWIHLDLAVYSAFASYWNSYILTWPFIEPPPSHLYFIFWTRLWLEPPPRIIEIISSWTWLLNETPPHNFEMITSWTQLLI